MTAFAANQCTVARSPLSAQRAMQVTVFVGKGLIVIMIFLLAASVGAKAAVEIYPAPAGETNGTRIELWFGSQKIPLAPRKIFHSDSKGQDFMEIEFARFATDDRVPLRLVSPQTKPGQAMLRTVGKDLPLQVLGKNSLEFELPGPGQYYLQLPSLAQTNSTFTVVFWVDDLQRLEQFRAQAQAPKVVNVADKGILSHPNLDQTKAVQSALDRGGLLYFPPGIYRISTIRIHSDTTIFLAPSAVLRALPGESSVGPEFIAIEKAEHVRICGPGAIDANSFTFRRQHNVHNVNITSCRDVTFEDVLFEESNSWAVHIRKCDHFAASNVRVLSGKDGFDPDASRDVLIDGAFVISGGDGIAVKNRFPEEADGKVTERVVFRNSIVSTFKSALKIGTETKGPVRDITFEKCDVFDADRGIVLYANDGGPVERAVWRNIRLFMKDWPREKESGSVFHLMVTRREAPTPVRDCLIENVAANWIYRSEFAGLSDAPLNGVTFRNIRATVELPKANQPSLFVCRDNVDIPVQNLAVDWQGHQSRWSGVVLGKGLTLTGLTQSGRDKINSVKEME